MDTQKWAKRKLAGRREGLVAVQKTVNRAGGGSHEQTFWIDPARLQHLKAAEQAHGRERDAGQRGDHNAAAQASAERGKHLNEAAKFHGQPIGTTTSGKHIHDVPGELIAQGTRGGRISGKRDAVAQEHIERNHGDYTAKDHEEAARAHSEHSDYYRESPGHHERAMAHEQMHTAHTAAAEMMRDQAAASGASVGKTKTGKDVAGVSPSMVKSYKGESSKDYDAKIDQHVKVQGYTPEEHRDAASAHHAASGTVQNHTVANVHMDLAKAHERAAAGPTQEWGKRQTASPAKAVAAAASTKVPPPPETKGKYGTADFISAAREHVAKQSLSPKEHFAKAKDHLEQAKEHQRAGDTKMAHWHGAIAGAHREAARTARGTK